MTTTAVSERPVLFSGPMVRAILDDRKTQTRRVVKYVPSLGEPEAWCDEVTSSTFEKIAGDYRRYCPYGQPGDRLWVRETFLAGAGVGGYARGVDPDKNPFGPTIDVIYRADDGTNERTAIGWRPSIHMPRWASRLTLEITDVRVERLCEISEEDAIAEGMRDDGDEYGGFARPARAQFRNLWDSLNEKRGFGWSTDPWVWVIAFRVLPSRVEGQR